MKQYIRDGKRLVESSGSIPSVDILVLAAHNDDEMFPAGYLLHRIGEGKKVGVVVATDGAGSNYRDLPSHKLVPLRTEESRMAIEKLGGSFFVGYPHQSDYIKSPEGNATFAGQLIEVIDRAQPGTFLVQSPFENHPTHLWTTTAGITAARRARHRVTEVKGYEVWAPLHGIIMTEKEFLDSFTARKKRILQSMYASQNVANDYPDATHGLNLFNYVMADAHTAARSGSLELYLDMTPLVSDARFSDVSPTDYGGGLLMLTQMIRTGVLKRSTSCELSLKQELNILYDVIIPVYCKMQEKVALSFCPSNS